MHQEYKMGEEQLWWVHYVFKRDLEPDARGKPEQGHAFFHARDEAELRKQIAGWQHYIKFDEIIVQAVELVSYDFKLELRCGPLPQLPEKQARTVLRAYREDGTRRRMLRETRAIFVLALETDESAPFAYSLSEKQPGWLFY